jgi:hypothetical protein
MSGTIPLLTLYAFITWTGTTLPLPFKVATCHKDKTGCGFGQKQDVECVLMNTMIRKTLRVLYKVCVYINTETYLHKRHLISTHKWYICSVCYIYFTRYWFLMVMIIKKTECWIILIKYCLTQKFICKQVILCEQYNRKNIFKIRVKVYSECCLPVKLLHALNNTAQRFCPVC